MQEIPFNKPISIVTKVERILIVETAR
jgi:hypothetical protein